MTRNALQIVVTSGPEDPDRARFALHAALAAAVSGLEVSVYLALRAAHWACTSHETNDVHAELRDLIERIRGSGVTVECCSACLERHCGTHAGALLSAFDVQGGVRPVGLVSLVRRASAGVQTITL